MNHLTFAITILTSCSPLAVAQPPKLEPLREFTVGKYRVTDLVLLPNGKELAWVAMQDGDLKARLMGPIRFLDVEKGTELKKWDLPAGKPASLLAISPDGKWLASAVRYVEPYSINLWDVKTGTIKHTLVGHKDQLNLFSFSPDSTRLVSCAGDRVIRVWTCATGDCTELRHMYDNFDFPGDPAFLDNDHLVIGSVGGHKITIWDLATKKIAEKHGPRVTNSMWSFTATTARSDGKAAAVSGFGGKVVLYTRNAAKSIEMFSVHDGCYQLRFQPNSHLLALAYQAEIRLWDSKSHKLAATIHLPEGTQTPHLAFSADGNLLACGIEQGKIRLYDMSKLRVPLE